MTPTEKKYAVAIGELFHYNWQYWRNWNEEQVQQELASVMVSSLTKDDCNGRYYYNLMVIGQAPVGWMKPEFKVACSEFSRYAKPLSNVG